MTKEARECQVALYALTQIPSHDKLTLKTSSGHLRRILTMGLRKMEDQDWLGKHNTETIQALIATLRARSSPTVIGKLDDRGTITNLKECVEADLSHQRNDEEPALTTPEAFQVMGVKLSNATQSLLY